MWPPATEGCENGGEAKLIRAGPETSLQRAHLFTGLVKLQAKNKVLSNTWANWKFSRVRNILGNPVYTLGNIPYFFFLSHGNCGVN